MIELATILGFSILLNICLLGLWLIERSASNAFRKHCEDGCVLMERMLEALKELSK